MRHKFNNVSMNTSLHIKLFFNILLIWGISSNGFAQVKYLPPVETKTSHDVDAENNAAEKYTSQDTIKEDSTPKNDMTSVSFDGIIYDAIITDEGDTLILANIDDISITALRTFESDEERAKYEKFRRYALKVFPYAKEAIRIFREVEYATEHLPRRKRKRRLKALEEELKREFEEPLTKLTKLQGKILLKMIEKETGKSTYSLLKQVKGGFRAFYWNQFSKLYGYKLSEGYEYGKYKILDAVLQDFDVSHRIENNSNLKYFNIEDLRK